MLHIDVAATEGGGFSASKEPFLLPLNDLVAAKLPACREFFRVLLAEPVHGDIELSEAKGAPSLAVEGVGRVTPTQAAKAKA